MERRREQDASPHLMCTAHSGMDIKTNILLALTSVATALLLIAINILIGISGGLATNRLEIQHMTDKIINLESRITRIERGEKL
jgi:hypothetical protein